MQVHSGHAAGLPDARALFSPDPTDTLRSSPRASRDTPERRLALAVLTRSLIDLRHYRPGRKDAGLHEQARRWFASSDASWPFSFVSVCQTFDLDPGAVRARVLGGTVTLDALEAPPLGRLRLVRR